MACLCEQIAGKDIELSPTCIGHLWIFENLELEEVKALSSEALRKKSEKGQALFLQGDPADEMFLIKGGRVKLTKVLEDGTELTLDIRKAGDFVGENMFSEEGQFPVSAYCLEDTLTCGFSRSQFEELVLQYPKVGLQIIKNLSERITWLTRRVGSLAVTNIEDRLYRVLSSVAKEHGMLSPQGTVIQFPLTHEDMSFLTGAHRVSITRAMKALKSAGKIIHEEKKLILPSLEIAYHLEFNRFNWLLSAAALTQNLLLAAHSKGLGTCWMTGPKYVEKEINELLNITDKELVSIIPIGYPDQSPPAPPRKEGVIKWVGF